MTKTKGRRALSTLLFHLLICLIGFVMIYPLIWMLFSSFKESGLVLVTGGGIVKDERNYQSLRQNGRIYQITRDLALLPREGRPLSLTTDM